MRQSMRFLGALSRMVVIVRTTPPIASVRKPVVRRTTTKIRSDALEMGAVAMDDVVIISTVSAAWDVVASPAAMVMITTSAASAIQSEKSIRCALSRSAEFRSLRNIVAVPLHVFACPFFEVCRALLRCGTDMRGVVQKSTWKWTPCGPNSDSPAYLVWRYQGNG